MEYSVEVVRSKRRTLSLSVEKDLRVLVRAPMRMDDAEVMRFVEKYRGWIEKHVALQRERRENAHEFSPEEVAALRRRALQLAEAGIRAYAPRMGVVPSGLKITSACTRWGSCSGKNSICFSWRIALLPQEAVDYIVVHELAHIRQKNHGPAFYAEVERYLPDYRQRIAVLKQAQRRLGL